MPQIAKKQCQQSHLTRMRWFLVYVRDMETLRIHAHIDEQGTNWHQHDVHSTLISFQPLRGYFFCETPLQCHQAGILSRLRDVRYFRACLYRCCHVTYTHVECDRILLIYTQHNIACLYLDALNSKVRFLLCYISRQKMKKKM